MQTVQAEQSQLLKGIPLTSKELVVMRVGKGKGGDWNVTLESRDEWATNRP